MSTDSNASAFPRSWNASAVSVSSSSVFQNSLARDCASRVKTIPHAKCPGQMRNGSLCKDCSLPIDAVTSQEGAICSRNFVHLIYPFFKCSINLIVFVCCQKGMIIQLPVQWTFDPIFRVATSWDVWIAS